MPPELARTMGRAKRSAIGTWTFAGGGLVVEGGRRVGQDDVAPLLARLPFPASWRCVLAVPHARAGVSGAAESRAFAELPSPPEGDVERVAYLVLMALLPALVEADIESFGAALSEIQEMTGRWFASAQGGTFAPGSADLVRCMAEGGARGVGQSSWGPAVYGIVDGQEASARLAEPRAGDSWARRGRVPGTVPIRWRAPVACADHRRHRGDTIMIRVSVLYPNSPGATFDMPYYIASHMQTLVKGKLGAALKGMQIDHGLGGGMPGVPPPYIAVGHLLFDSVEAFQAAFGPVADAILGDIPNYTNVQPAVQVSEVKM